MKKLYVSNKDESVRMFKSDFLEAFTKVHYSVPLFVFIPVVVYSLYRAVMSDTLTFLAGIGMFVVGLATWTIVEYVMHRFVFHYEPPGKLGKELHFIFHGVHHDYPNDSKRLVMPPSMSIPLAIGFYFLFRSIISGDLFFPFFAGLVLGYLMYDMLHYAIHHVEFKGRMWNELKAHHLKHHFKDPDKGYGVSSKLWDIVIGSDFKKKNEKTRNQKEEIESELYNG